MNQTIDNLQVTSDRIRKTTIKNLVIGHRSKVKGHKGFTLIELLVVIAIIGILMTFLTIMYSAVRARSRDAQRKSDLRQIQSALELYRADNDSYPTTNVSPANAFYGASPCGGQFVGTGATPPVYMNKIPCDPQSSNGAYRYVQTSSTTYVLASCIENTGDQDSNITSVLPVTTPAIGLTCTSGRYYVLYNP